MKSSYVVISVFSTLTLAAQAAAKGGLRGAWAQVEVGRSNVGLSSTLPLAGSDDHGQAVKVFGGYRFNKNLGVEAGDAALGSCSKSVAVNGLSIKQDGKARGIVGAAIARLALGESFAPHGRLGRSPGKVSGTNLLPASDNLVGSKTSVLFGVSGEYRPKPNITLRLNVDRNGKLSNNVKASALLVGLHFTL